MNPKDLFKTRKIKTQKFYRYFDKGCCLDPSAVFGGISKIPSLLEYLKTKRFILGCPRPSQFSTDNKSQTPLNKVSKPPNHPHGCLKKRSRRPVKPPFWVNVGRVFTSVHLIKIPNIFRALSLLQHISWGMIGKESSRG